MTLAATVVAHLARRGVPSAVIGGVALAVHGIARATVDLDLLAADAGALDPRTWEDFSESPADIRRGGQGDPLDGVVRFQRAVVGRAVHSEVGGERLPVVDVADLILLKLYAGGPQDLLDVKLMLEALPGAAVDVDAWREQILPGRG